MSSRAVFIGQHRGGKDDPSAISIPYDARPAVMIVEQIAWEALAATPATPRPGAARQDDRAARSAGSGFSHGHLPTLANFRRGVTAIGIASSDSDGVGDEQAVVVGCVSRGHQAGGEAQGRIGGSGVAAGWRSGRLRASHKPQKWVSPGYRSIRGSMVLVFVSPHSDPKTSTLRSEDRIHPIVRAGRVAIR